MSVYKLKLIFIYLYTFMDFLAHNISRDGDAESSTLVAQSEDKKMIRVFFNYVTEFSNFHCTIWTFPKESKLLTQLRMGYLMHVEG